MPKGNVGGVPFAVTDLSSAVDWVIGLHADAAARGIPVRLMNAYCVALASEDPAYRAVVTGAGMNFPDGAPVAWALRRAGQAAEQVRGPSLFIETLRRGRERGMRHYFFGTTDDTLKLLEKRLAELAPGVDVAGMRSAPFADVDTIVSDELVEAISQAAPDLVWVGLGTPKQDFVAAKLAQRLGIPCLGVGAAFDFAAGTVKEAPPVFNAVGMEWAYRLGTEPRRLWRRYLWGNTRFMKLAGEQLFRVRMSKR